MMKGAEMTIVLRRGFLLALFAGLVAFPSCSSEQGGHTNEPSTTYESTPEAPTTMPPVSQPESAPMWTPPSATPSAGAADPTFAGMQEERALAEQRNDLLVESYVLAARRHIANGDLDKAEASALQALQVRGTDLESIDLLRQIRVLKGDDVDATADMGVWIMNRRKLVRQAQVERVNDHYAKANRAFDSGNYSEAVSELNQANLVMEFDAYQTDFGGMASQVPAMLTASKNKLNQFEKASQEAGLREIWERQREDDLRERMKEKELITQMMVRAVESYVREDFDNAEVLARRVLDAEPGMVEAKELLEASKNARNAVWRRNYGQRRQEKFQKWLEDVRETQIPYTELLTWPDRADWQALTKKRQVNDTVSYALEDSDAVRTIKAKLENETITIDNGSEGAPLNEVVKQIRRTQGFNILLSGEVMTEHGETPVTDTYIDQKLGSVLKVMLGNLDLAYTFRDDALVITTKDKALGTPYPKVYEVRDLTISLPNFKAPDLTLRAGPAGEASARAVAGEPLDSTTETEIDTLVELVRTTVHPTTWDLPGFGITPSSGQIVATTTPEIHSEVNKFLDNLRRFSRLSVHVEARFISMRRGYLMDVGVDFRGLGGQNPGTVSLLDDITNGSPYNASGGLDNGGAGSIAGAAQAPTSGMFFREGNNDLRGRSEGIFDRGLGSFLTNQGGAAIVFSILDDLQISGVLRAVEKDVDTTLVNAPRLTVYNGQRANLTLVNQITYVKDYDVEVAQTAFIADPLVDVIQDGLTLDVLPVVSHDRKYVRMEVKPTLATLRRPIRTFESNLSGLTTPVVIELPELTYSQAATTVNVPDGGYVVIGGLKNITTVDRRSEVPILSNIPLISFLFSRKGRSDEIRDLMIVMHVRILDLTEQESLLVK